MKRSDFEGLKEEGVGSCRSEKITAEGATPEVAQEALGTGSLAADWLAMVTPTPL